jgi:hypothetical protein
MFDDAERTAGPAEFLDENSRATRGEGDVFTSQAQMTMTRTRYRDAAMSWLALGALLAAWHMEARLERSEPVASARLALVRSGSPRGTAQPWLSRAEDQGSWIARAPHGARAEVRNFSARQPHWSALASVRTARRWLSSL